MRCGVCRRIDEGRERRVSSKCGGQATGLTIVCRRAPPSFSSLRTSAGGCGVSVAQKRHFPPHCCANGILLELANCSIIISLIHGSMVSLEFPDLSRLCAALDPNRTVEMVLCEKEARIL